MKSWFKIVITLFLIGVLYLGWEYLQIQKQSVINGRYAPGQYNFVVDTQTGILYKQKPIEK